MFSVCTIAGNPSTMTGTLQTNDCDLNHNDNTVGCGISDGSTRSYGTGFNAINDIWSLMSFRNAGLGDVPNDALALAQLTNLPTELWILVWAVLAILMMGASIYLALIRPRE